jgi:glutaredoxin-related protein
MSENYVNKSGDTVNKIEKLKSLDLKYHQQIEISKMKNVKVYVKLWSSVISDLFYI